MRFIKCFLFKNNEWNETNNSVVSNCFKNVNLSVGTLHTLVIETPDPWQVGFAKAGDWEHWPLFPSKVLSSHYLSLEGFSYSFFNFLDFISALLLCNCQVTSSHLEILELAR